MGDRPFFFCWGTHLKSSLWKESAIKKFKHKYQKGLFGSYLLLLGFPGGTSGKEPASRCRRQETHVWSLGGEDPLEEGMATHSSILAWRIPWAEEPGGLWSIGSQRHRHDWSNLAHTYASFANKGPSSESYGFSSGHVWMWELDSKESWAVKNWCFWTVILEKTLESPLDSKEIQPVHLKGDQSWVFIGRTDAEAETPILWPPDAKSQLIGKDPDAGKDWGQEEKGMAEDEVVRWHHWLNGHEFE